MIEKFPNFDGAKIHKINCNQKVSYDYHNMKDITTSALLFDALIHRMKLCSTFYVPQRHCLVVEILQFPHLI